MFTGLQIGLKKGLHRGQFRGLRTGLAKGLEANTVFKRAAKDPILIVGDSIPAGLISHAESQRPVKGTVLEYDRNTSTIRNFGDGPGILGYSYNMRSPWAKFGTDWFANTGRVPIIINRASASSTCSPSTSGMIGNDWQTTGYNYAPAVAAAKDCLSKIGQTKLAGIIIILLTNDGQGVGGTGSNTVAQVGTYLATLISNLQAEFGTDVPIHFAIIGQAVGFEVSQRMSGLRDVIKKQCVTTAACQVGANLTMFESRGLLESDHIHPNMNGNDIIGAQFARSFKFRNKYSKWALAIICSAFTEFSSEIKNNINTWFNNHVTEYLNGIDCMVMSMKDGSVPFDWALLCNPSANGGYTLNPNGTIATAGNTSSLFMLGYDPAKTLIKATTTDYGVQVKITQANTVSGVTASLTGALATVGVRAVLLRQLNTLGINWACVSSTSYTYAGENSFSAAEWKTKRAGTGLSLLKNAVQVDSRTGTASSFPLGEWYLGAHNQDNGTKSSPEDAVYSRFISIAPSAIISSEATWMADLDTLQS